MSYNDKSQLKTKCPLDEKSCRKREDQEVSQIKMLAKSKQITRMKGFEKRLKTGYYFVAIYNILKSKIIRIITLIQINRTLA